MSFYTLEMQRDVSPCGLFSFVWHPCALRRNIQSFWFSENFKSCIQSFLRFYLLGFVSQLAHARMGPCLIHCEHKWFQKEYLNMVIWEVPCLVFVMTISALRFPSGHELLRISAAFHTCPNLISMLRQESSLWKKNTQIKNQTYLLQLILFYVCTHLSLNRYLWNGNCSRLNAKPPWQVEQE